MQNLYLREYAARRRQAQFAASDERLNRLFAAGRETFRQNALDIFMDCPSRERAGWLCDSFFTARVAKDLCGDTRVERNFFENFLLPAEFAFLPDGMLPMCYPADHNDGVFIPNWALWFVVELEEYLARSGDRETVDALRPRVLRLFDYFKKFRNEDGLLEKLESWVFVEWSAANSFVQDVNYPVQHALRRSAGRGGPMYGLPELTADAERIRETIRRQSFDGRVLRRQCRARERQAAGHHQPHRGLPILRLLLRRRQAGNALRALAALVKEFGPQRKQTKAFPEVHPANAFIGNVLRLELLSRYGLCQQLLDESLAYQLYMADRTGTLWENDGAYASCDHGFASHGGVHVLYRDVLGLQQWTRSTRSSNSASPTRAWTGARGACRQWTARLSCAGAKKTANGFTTSPFRPAMPSRPKTPAPFQPFNASYQIGTDLGPIAAYSSDRLRPTSGSTRPPVSPVLR